VKMPDIATVAAIHSSVTAYVTNILNIVFSAGFKHSGLSDKNRIKMRKFV